MNLEFKDNLYYIRCVKVLLAYLEYHFEDEDVIDEGQDRNGVGHQDPGLCPQKSVAAKNMIEDVFP